MVRFEGTNVVGRATRDAPGVYVRLRAAVALAAYVAEEAGPIGAPSEELPPGPHRHGDIVVTFWRFYPQARGYFERPRELARTLRAFHDVAGGYTGELPAAFDYVDGAIRAVGADERVDSAARTTATDAWRLLRPQIESAAGRQHVLHGDAHVGNVVDVAGRLLWVDCEYPARGPVEWDLACLLVETRTLRRRPDLETEALPSYGAFDASLVDLLVAYRVLEFAARTALRSDGSPEFWLAWLRTHLLT